MMTQFKYSFLLLISVLISTLSVAQTTVDNSLTVEEVVNQFLMGEGVEAFNITYNGFQANTIQSRVGSFNAETSDFNFEEGMVMATRDVPMVVCGPEGSADFGGDDDDLSSIVSNTLNDISVIEFFFIPEGDTVKFNFIFASREYHTYSCSNFNDVFGFFISGPGIDGPYTNQAENIALLPDGVTPVSINNVNNGNPSGQQCELTDGTFCPCNSQYFIDNGGNLGNGLASDICLGGYTVPLVAQYPVQCGETYRMKLALANVGDTGFQSAVFLEKGSFESNLNVDLEINPVLPGFEVGDEDFSDGLVAGCTNGQFCLFRNDTVGIDTAYFEIGGSAEAGVHYIAPEENLVIFPEGVDTVCVDIITLPSGGGSQVDSLSVTTFAFDPCTGDTITATGSINIYNEYSFEVSTNDVNLECPEDLAILSGEATAGLSPYTYEWFLTDSTTEVGTGAEFQVDPPPMGESMTYILSVTDACGLAAEYESITVTNNTQPAPVVNVEIAQGSGDTISCVGQTVDLTATATGGQGELTYLWSNNESGTETTVSPDGSQTVTYYFVTVTDECGLTGTDSIPVYFVPDPPTVSISTSPSDTVNCPGDEVFLTANASSSSGDVGYSWNTGEGAQTITVTLDGSEPISYYYVTVTDECNATASDSVAIYFVPLDPPIADPGEDVTVECPGDEVELTATAIGGSAPFQYQWQPGGNGQSITVSPSETQSFMLTITDNCLAVSEPAEVTVNVPVYDPIAIDLPSPTSLCPGDPHVLSPEVSGGAGIYEYEWSPGGQTTSFITVSPLQTAQYGVQVTDQCGNAQQTGTLVEVEDNPPIAVTPNARPSCTGESFTLSVADISGGAGETASDYFYAWVGPIGQFIDSTEVSSTGSITLTDAEPGIYTLFVIDACGDTASKSIDANLLGIEFIPNVLTPNNGDNVNDVFIVPGSSIYDTKVTIMDRWGKVAFESDQYVCDRTNLEDPGTLINQNCWKGEDDKGDVFYYIIDVDNGTCGFQGTVHLLDNN